MIFVLWEYLKVVLPLSDWRNDTYFIFQLLLEVLYSVIMYGPYQHDTSVIDTNAVSITCLIILTFVRFQASPALVVEAVSLLECYLV